MFNRQKVRAPDDSSTQANRDNDNQQIQPGGQTDRHCPRETLQKREVHLRMVLSKWEIGAKNICGRYGLDQPQGESGEQGQSTAYTTQHKQTKQHNKDETTTNNEKADTLHIRNG